MWGLQPTPGDTDGAVCRARARPPREHVQSHTCAHAAHAGRHAREVRGAGGCHLRGRGARPRQAAVDKCGKGAEPRSGHAGVDVQPARLERET